MQGLGRPIISCESHGYRLVVVGNQVRWSTRWATFVDFLFDYIRAIFTPEWGQAELAKPESDQHPLMHWMRRINAFVQAHEGAYNGPVFTTSMTGLMRAFLGLAYDLYLCAHNTQLPQLLLTRLRNAKTFEGALYEASVIGAFAKAGFEIEFEDETDPTISHCEFTARHSKTGQRFSVEAKAISSISGRAGNTDKPARIRNLLYAALRKHALHDRIIFIELNRAQKSTTDREPEWAGHVREELAIAEAELTIGRQPAPQAYVFVTNRAFMHSFDTMDWSESIVVRGFKIPDFPPGRSCTSLLQAVDARERHLESLLAF